MQLLPNEMQDLPLNNATNINIYPDLMIERGLVGNAAGRVADGKWFGWRGMRG